MTDTVPSAGWLALEREGAWRELARLKPPARTVEAWRRMDYAAWDLEALKAGSRPAAAPTGRAGAAPPGVELLSLEEAAARYPELVRRELAPAAAEPFRGLEAANRALWAGGFFLRVPKGARIEAPVELPFLYEGRRQFPRALVLAEEGSDVSVIESHVASDVASDGRSPSRADHKEAVASISVAFSKLVVGPGARVRYFYSQELPDTAVHFWSQEAAVGAGAELSHHSVILGGARHKSELDVRLAGRGARSEIRGVLLGRGRQLFDPWTSQRHLAPHTRSDLLFRTVLRDQARSIYTGLIRVEKEAVESDAYQANHNLLLSEKARADTTPILEILTDAVRCKHGATAGPLDQEELFYLASRGLPEAEAARLLILGFFEPILGQIPAPGMAERIARQVEAAVAGGRL